MGLKQNSMDVFVINLRCRTDKRDHIIKEGERYCMSLKVVDAVRGSELSDQDLSESVHDYPACGLTKGVIGCALSHLKIYKKMMDENLPIALILEDDAILHEDLPEIIKKIESIDKNKQPEVYLLSSHYYKAVPLRRLNEKYSVHRFIDGSQGHGYILNLEAAKSLYSGLQPIKWEADKWYYFQQMGLASVNCIVPSIIRVNGSPNNSDLFAERAVLKRKRQRYLISMRGSVGARQQIRKIMWKYLKRPFSTKS